MKVLNYTFLLLSVLLLASCTEKQQPVYVVDQVALYQSASEKKNLKTETEFISIAYNDIFGKNITLEDLENAELPYIAFGDKEFIIDLLIRNYLNDTDALLPTDQEMRADIDQFVEDTYLRVYNRYPNEVEVWKLKQLIEKNASITSDMIYYAMMTAEEYRYY